MNAHSEMIAHQPKVKIDYLNPKCDASNTLKKIFVSETV